MCMFFCRVRSSIDARYMHEILRSLSQHCRPQPSETAACARVWGDVLRSCPTSAPRLPEPRTNNTENHCGNTTEQTSQAKPRSALPDGSYVWIVVRDEQSSRTGVGAQLHGTATYSICSQGALPTELRSWAGDDDRRHSRLSINHDQSQIAQSLSRRRT